jgi:hypothetical protein
MSAKINDKITEKKRIIDYLSLTRINLIFYTIILALAVFVAYITVAQFLRYESIWSKEDITAIVERNSAEDFGDGMHPVIVINAATSEEAVITVSFTSAEYEMQYSSGEITTNYTAFAILPKELFSTEFIIKILATGEEETHSKEIKLKPLDKPEVLFRIN